MNKKQFQSKIKTEYQNIVKQSAQNCFASNIFGCCQPLELRKDERKKSGFSKDQITANPVNSILKVSINSTNN